MNSPNDPIQRALDRHGITVDAQQLQRLQGWAHGLVAHGQKINLTGTLDPERIAEEFIADSLQILALLPAEVAAMIDVGSGAGIPGLILASMITVPTLLIEPRLKRAMFLRHASRMMNMVDQVRVAQDRLEDVPDAALDLPSPRLWVSRAVFAPDNWLATVAGYARPDDLCAVWHNGTPALDATVLPAWTLVATRSYDLDGPGARTAGLYRFDAKKGT